MSANTFAQLLKVRHVSINQLHHCFRPVGSVVYRAGGCIDDRDGFTPPGASTPRFDCFVEFYLTDSSGYSVHASTPFESRCDPRRTRLGYRNARPEQVWLPTSTIL